MRNSVVGSGLVHLAVLLALFMVRSPGPRIVPGPDVVQVSILEPSALDRRPPPPKPAPEPEPVVKAPDIRPTEDTGIKLTPPKPKPKPKEEPKPKEPPPPPSLSVSLPSQRVGSAGLSGEVAVDQTDFEFTYYLILVRNRIAQNWSPPAGLVTGGKPVRAVVYFKIGRGGDVYDTRIETGSHAEFFDRSALRAVLISNPLPPLPLGYSGSELGVHFGFEYSGP